MRRNIIPYLPELKELAREKRNNPTVSEKLLWQRLKGKQLNCFNFDRQKPINNFIVDFYCPDLKLVIEIDGGSHIGKEVADDERQKILESFEIKFLRFTNDDVIQNIEGVLETISSFINQLDK